MADLLGERDHFLRLIERAFSGRQDRRPRQRDRPDRGRRSGGSHRVRGAADPDPGGPGARRRPRQEGHRAREAGGAFAVRHLPQMRFVSVRGRQVRPKTLGQKRYVDAVRDNTMVIGVGPAGTGKTYLAMACAVEALVTGSVRRIILTRPAVEAGERLGFLPGDLTAKVDPYLRPLFRRSLRDARPRRDGAPDGARNHRDRPARLHERAHPQRRLHRAGRGAEHISRANEDVPDAARVQLQDGDHGRRHPGRSRRRSPLRAPAGRRCAR